MGDVIICVRYAPSIAGVGLARDRALCSDGLLRCTQLRVCRSRIEVTSIASSNIHFWEEGHYLHAAKARSRWISRVAPLRFDCFCWPLIVRTVCMALAYQPCPFGFPKGA